MPANSSDELWMRRAIALSRRGFPAPNPHVGCVIVRDERIVGEGFHRYAGGPHAEVEALRQAGEQARGSTVYVTLEPCNHTGRTPPCSDALIAAGAARVVVACADPNPKARGGRERLCEAGVAVETGVLEDEASATNRRFLYSMRARRPYVVLKAAVSLDGRIALPNGESKWITGEKARREAHSLRAEMGAVLVGRRTVELDDPLLTARLPGVRNQPTPVVLDPKGRLFGSDKRLLNNPQLVWVTAAGGPGNVVVPVSEGGFDLRLLLDALWQRGHTGLLVEGGSQTISRFLEAGFADRIELFMAPKVLGAGPSWVEGKAKESVEQCLEAGAPKVRKLGDDLWISCDLGRGAEGNKPQTETSVK